jgi:hypothetical protein
METFLRPILLDLPKWGVLEGSAGECNSTLMPEVCWIGWYSVVCTHAFIPIVWRERHGAPIFVTIKRHLVHGEVREAENIMKAGLEE